MAIYSSTSEKMRSKGFILDTENHLLPMLRKASEEEWAGIESRESLIYLFAISVIYKFNCEDLNADKFENTRKYIKAYTRESLNPKSWFPSIELRILRENRSQFFDEFLFHLRRDVRSYHSPYIKDLVKHILDQSHLLDEETYQEQVYG